MHNILCYGDSNTWGVDTEKENKRIGYEKRWTQIMAGNLDKDYHVIEEGLPGRTTVFEDPFGYGRHGEKYFEIALLSHFFGEFISLVISFLTSKIKNQFHFSVIYIMQLQRTLQRELRGLL